jgi:hypothetical protein
MLSHPVRAMLKSYAIRGPLWIYIHLCQVLQGTSRLLQVDTSLLLQGILQFSFAMNFPHGLTTALGFSRLHQHVFKDSLLGFMASRLLYFASWLQGFFNWLHGFNTQTISRLIYLASWLQRFFTCLHGFNASSLGFMDSILKQSPFFNTMSSSSLLHTYHYYHIIIIIATWTSMPTFSQQSPPLSFMETPSSFCSDACSLYLSLCFSPLLTSMEKG